MVFSSIEFIVFFLLVTLLLYYNPFFKSRSFRNIILFLASIVFYAWGEPVFVFVLLFSVGVNWGIGLLLAKQKAQFWRKVFLILALAYDISLLFVFKYLGFVAENIGLLLHKDLAVNIALPIGISFFTFQIMSYVIDLYRGKVSVQKNVLWLGLYVMMFPQLVAGPVVRYETIADEIENRKENWNDFTDGFFRFVYGLAKKIIIANQLATLADKAFAASELSVVSAWLGVISYSLQIYFDFSGYSDMAIGLGRMFGFHFEENFNYPYIAKSATEFWRRWHISMSSWFRDYVYFPLGGSRVKKTRQYFNLFVVWLLTGIWHGANWTYIQWGLFFFCILVMEKYIKVHKLPKCIAHVYTLVIVGVSMALFRAESVPAAWAYVGRLFGIGAKSLIDNMSIEYLHSYFLYILIGVIACLPIGPLLRKNKRLSNGTIDVLNSVYVVVLFVVCLAFILSSSYNPFIYFNF